MTVANNLPDHAVIAAHAISVAAILGTFAGWLPPLAALAAIIWYAINIYESKTVQAWLAQRRGKSNAPKSDGPVT